MEKSVTEGKKKVTTTTADRIVRPAEQVLITGRCLASLWRDQRAGTYPQNVRIGRNAVGVLLSQLIAWMASRVSVADAPRAVAHGAKRGRKPKSAEV